MLHLLLYGALAILLAGGLFAVAARFLPAGEQIAPPVRDEPPWELPVDRALSAEEIDEVRLPVALRGYRFAETDALLDRLAAELRARDTEIDRLRGHAVAEPTPTGDVLVKTADEGAGESRAAEVAAGEHAGGAAGAAEPVEEPAAGEPVPAPVVAAHRAVEAPDETPASLPEPASSGYWATNAPPWAVAPAPWVVGPGAEQGTPESGTAGPAGEQPGESGSTHRRRRRK